MKNNIFSYLRKYCFIIFPVFTFIVFLVLYIVDIFNLNKSNYSTIINVSATLLGFDFLLLTFLHSFDDNKNFIKRLKEKQYFKILTINIIFALIFYLLSLSIGIFEINILLCALFFVLGLTNTAVACYFISLISYYLSK